jgi:DNA-directed RNA polymerase specialized sigma24 family protein
MLNETQPNRIAQAMSQLSEEHRDILVYINVKGMSYAETAKVLNTSEKAVRFILSSARASLQSILDTPVPAQKKIYMNPCALGFTPTLAQAA